MVPPEMPTLIPKLLEHAADESEPAAGRLFSAALLQGFLEDYLPALAQQAREEGATWADLGMVLKITRQAAQKRFSETSYWFVDRSSDEPEPQELKKEDFVEMLVDKISNEPTDKLPQSLAELPEEAVEKLPEAIREWLQNRNDK